jgi:hypothetical protein
VGPHYTVQVRIGVERARQATTSKQMSREGKDASGGGRPNKQQTTDGASLAKAGTFPSILSLII